MSQTEEISVQVGAPDGVAAGFACLSDARRRWARWPGVRPLSRALRPLLRRARAVAEPPGSLSMRRLPQRPGRSDCGGLTVLSANLWHDWPRHRRLQARLEDFSRLAEDQEADVILLQEVARTPDLWADHWLAERLGMAYVYSRANGHAGGIGFEEGLAVFSRFPLREPQLQQLGPGRNPFVRRLALGAAVETPCGPLLAFSVHLGLLATQNAGQLAHLRAWVGQAAAGTPALIGGDFNAGEASPQIAQAQRTWLDTYRHLHPRADGTTHELRLPWGGLLRRARLDYIFLHVGAGAWQVVEARHLPAQDEPHSDHRTVLVRLAPPQGSPVSQLMDAGGVY